MQVVRELQGAQRGRLVVETLTNINSYLIPPLVSRFKQRFQAIHLQVHTQPSTDIVVGLLVNRWNAEICLLPVHDERLTVVLLFDERLVLVAPSNGSIKKSRLRMQDLARLPLVLMPFDYCLRKMVEAACADARIQTQVVLEMTSSEGILQAVAAGAGLTILPEIDVRMRPPTLSFQTIELCDPVPHHRVRLAYWTDRYQNLAAKEFARLCEGTVNGLMAQAMNTVSRKGRMRAA